MPQSVRPVFDRNTSMKKSKIRSRSSRSQASSKRPTTVRRLAVETLCERRVLATISGMVFSDVDDDWRAAAHEVKLAQRLVFADRNDNGLPDDGEPFALTDADGHFSLEQLGSDDHIVRLFSGAASQQQQFPVHPDWNPANINLAGLQLAAESGNLKLDPFSGRAIILAEQGIKIADLVSRETIDVGLDATPRDIAFLADGGLLILATDGQGRHAFRVDSAGLVQPVDLVSGATSDAEGSELGDSTADANFTGWAAVSVDADGHGVLIPGGESDSAVVRQLFAASGGITSWETTTSVKPGASLISGGAVTTVIAEPTASGLDLSLWSNSTGTLVGNQQVPVAGAEKLLAYSDSTGLAFVLMSADIVDASRSIVVLDAAADFAPLQTIDDLEEFVAIDTQRSVVFAWSSETSRLRAIDALTAQTVADWMLELDLGGEPLELALHAAADELVLLGTAGLATISLDRIDAHRVKLDGSIPTYPLRFAAKTSGENQPPQFVEPLEFDVVQGQSLLLPQGELLVRAVDPDGDSMALIRSSSPQHGVATVTPAGALNYSPDADFYGTDTFQVLLHDGRGASAETTVKIHVSPLVAPEPELTITVHPVPENVDPGYIVGEIEVFGFGGRPLVFLIDDPRFEVIDGLIVVAPGALLNYEEQYLITTNVTALDEETEQSITRTFSVQVTDEDDPIEDIQPRSASVHENVAGELIAELMVIDEDAEQPFFFSVDDDRFEIHHRNLRLKPGVSLNYEAGSEVIVNITATDALGGGNSLTVPFTIEVIDVAEPAGSIALTNNTVMEWVPGAEVGKIIIDGLPIGNSYVASVDDSRFEIVGGVLKLRNDEFLTFSIQQEAQLIISVRDAGQVFLAVSETFLVIVLENENPFHNPDNPYDVNSDGSVTPLDALLILNALSRNGGGGPISTFSPPGRYWDVNGDGLITPLDALLIINYINYQNRNPGLSEPEAQVQAPQQNATPQSQQRSWIAAESVDGSELAPALLSSPQRDLAEFVPAFDQDTRRSAAPGNAASLLALRVDRALEILARRPEWAADWTRAIDDLRTQWRELEQTLQAELTPEQLQVLHHLRAADNTHDVTMRLIARVDTFLDRLDRA